MVKKIIHIADIHIRTFQLHELYKRQFDLFLEDVKKQVSGYDYDEIRVVIAGDIAHQKINISNEQMMLTSWFINELANDVGRVVIIPGNHDFLENNTQRLDSITPIVELLNNDKIKYYKNGGLYQDENINWVVYSLYEHNERPKFVKEEGKFHIGLFHGVIQGMSTDLGFQFEDGYNIVNFQGCDIVMCGDIHKRSILNLESEIEVDENLVDHYLKNGWKIIT